MHKGSFRQPNRWGWLAEQKRPAAARGSQRMGGLRERGRQDALIGCNRRNMPSGRLQKRLNATRDHVFQRRQGGELGCQLPQLLRARHARRKDQNARRRLRADTTPRGINPDQEQEQDQDRKGARSPREEGPEGPLTETGGQGPQAQGGRRPLEHDLSRDEVTSAHDGFAERAKNGRCVEMVGV